MVNPLNRIAAYFRRDRVPADGHPNGHAEFSFTGGASTLGLGVGPAGAVGVNTGPVGMRPLGQGADVLDTVALPPNLEVVSANGAWAGVGALNMQVLANGVNSRGERMDPPVVEAMLDDAMVRACVDTRKTKMLCGELRFHPSVEEDDDDAGEGGATASGADPAVARWAAEFCDRAHRNMDVPIPVWAWGFADYLSYGHKVAEKVLEEVAEGPDAGLFYLKALKIKGRWAYHLATDPFFNPVAVYAQTAWGPAYVEWRHFLVMSNQPVDSDPRGTSILRAAREAWRRKQRRLRSQTKGDDQFGTASVVMKLAPNTPVESSQKRPDGTPMSTVDATNMELEKFMAGSAMVVPDGAEIYVVESGRDGSQLVNSINYDDREIARAILNTNGAGILEPEHYTQGSGEHAQSKERGLGDSDRDAFLAAVRRQVFHYLLEENFGRRFADLYTPKVTMGEMFVDDFLKLASPLSVMGQSGMLYQTWLDFLMQQAGFPRPKKGELRIGPDGLIPDEPPPGPLELAAAKASAKPAGKAAEFARGGGVKATPKAGAPAGPGGNGGLSGGHWVTVHGQKLYIKGDHIQAGGHYLRAHGGRHHGTRFRLSPKQKAGGHVVVHASVHKLEHSLASDPGGFHVGAGGSGQSAVKGRYEEAHAFMDKSRQGAGEVHPVEAHVKPDGGAALGDGRHRFAALRDSGATSIPVAVHKGQAADFHAKFGHEPERTSQSIQREREAGR